ncbi:MAG: hypothetical protein BMS9Abin08_1051 [Gammaproteobacteria bacterium]|nr:MAG: hypothetical protein BMS9Abin08_1051 [Gammaproteobacteria bacterium]
MKIAHIHKFGASGGAGGAVSMRRLNAGLIHSGVDSRILCVEPTDPSPGVVVAPPSRIERKLNRLTASLTKDYGLEDILNVNARRIRKHPFFQAADVVNFHRIPDVISYLSLPGLTRDKPGVYTLCDMWGLTGHCRNSLDCERWKTGCGKCPMAHLPPAIKHDLTGLQWKLKKSAYSRSNITVVAKSTWFAELARESILGCFPIHLIPNGIDTDLYRPKDRDESRSTLGIPAGKTVFMCMAQNFERFQKGGDLLIKALEFLPASLKSDIILLTLGHKGEDIATRSGLASVNLGYVSDDAIKTSAFSAADLFLFPSRAEIFGNVALESLACGTPVVAFNTCGNPDIVRHDITGHLAEPENPRDFCQGIIRLLEDQPLREKLGRQGRETAVNEFHFELIVQKYIDLYKSLT